MAIKKKEVTAFLENFQEKPSFIFSTLNPIFGIILYNLDKNS